MCAPAAGRAAAEGALLLEARTFQQDIIERIVETRALWNISIAMRRVLWAAHRNDIENMRSARVQAHVSTNYC